jgi:hypothetical protein
VQFRFTLYVYFFLKVSFLKHSDYLQGEITTSSRLSPTLIRNKNQRGFFKTFDKRTYTCTFYVYFYDMEEMKLLSSLNTNSIFTKSFHCKIYLLHSRIWNEARTGPSAKSTNRFAQQTKHKMQFCTFLGSATWIWSDNPFFVTVDPIKVWQNRETAMFSNWNPLQIQVFKTKLFSRTGKAWMWGLFTQSDRYKVHFVMYDTLRSRTTQKAQTGSILFLSYNTICRIV